MFCKNSRWMKAINYFQKRYVLVFDNVLNLAPSNISGRSTTLRESWMNFQKINQSSNFNENFNEFNFSRKIYYFEVKITFIKN